MTEEQATGKGSCVDKISDRYAGNSSKLPGEGCECESDYIIEMANNELFEWRDSASSSLTSTTMPFGLAISTERAKTLEVLLHFISM